VGVPTEEMSVTIPLRALFERGPVRPSHYGDCIPTRDFPVLIDLYRKGRLDLEAFVSETISLDGVPQAFERLERGDVLRSVVVF
jgi:S-(hydroxymethyl)mycothiol dehydrogenase